MRLDGMPEFDRLPEEQRAKIQKAEDRFWNVCEKINMKTRAANFSKDMDYLKFEDNVLCSEFTAYELMTIANIVDREQITIFSPPNVGLFRAVIKDVAEEAKKLIVAIRSVGGGGIERTVLPDGSIHPSLDFMCDLETGKRIDELYDQTILNLRRIAARAMKNNATIQKIGADAKRGADAAEKVFNEMQPMQAGVELLVKSKLKRIEDGRKAQAKAKVDPDVLKLKERAAADMKCAIARVRDDRDVKAGKHGAVLAACRRVCNEFRPLTTKKNALGKFERYAPLLGENGKPIQPDTLAKNYRMSRTRESKQ